jgi:nucleoporin SEH1
MTTTLGCTLVAAAHLLLLHTCCCCTLHTTTHYTLHTTHYSIYTLHTTASTASTASTHYTLQHTTATHYSKTTATMTIALNTGFTIKPNLDSHVLDSLHADYCQQVALDTYGRKLATCAGDKTVRIWELNEAGDWESTAHWAAHRSAVTSLTWAHPEFGSLLVTCGGTDAECKIWEERTSSNRFICKATLTEARRAVTCAQFAPRQYGLKLAIGSADGCVRIYEAVDIMNLAQWPLNASLQAFTECCNALSWCHARFEPPTLVAAGPQGKIVIYRYSEAARAWQVALQIVSPDAHAVLDVAWAPNVGRRFHLIAAAQETCIKIYRLSRDISTSDDSATDKDNTVVLEHTQTISVNAWRCQWNVTGTVLASAGDGGLVHLYKADRDRTFYCVAYVQGIMGGGSLLTEPMQEDK